MKKCHICENEIEPFMSFGKMPIANGFIQSNDYSNEYFFDLEVAYCSICTAVQVPSPPSKEKMFHSEYPFFSGSSLLMQEHFDRYALEIQERYLLAQPDPFVVEIGCNDGILLKNFAKRGIRHLGVDPSENVVTVASKQGLNVTTDFFDPEVSRRIVAKYGQADIFVAANVMCHIPKICDIARGIQLLLKPRGVAVFEEPYLGDVLETTAYDQIYDEHVFLFSAHSVQNIFNMVDMELIDVSRQATHGGSMRYTVAHRGKFPVSDDVKEQIIFEEHLGLFEPSTYDNFRERCEESRDNLMDLLSSVVEQQKTIVGYAATSKSTTVLNYCGINEKLLPYIVDTTPCKQGRVSPGMHVPIRPSSCFSDPYPDYALLFAYNHKKEIFAKESEFSRRGGKWILFVPEVGIIEQN